MDGPAFREGEGLSSLFLSLFVEDAMECCGLVPD